MACARCSYGDASNCIFTTNIMLHYITTFIKIDGQVCCCMLHVVAYPLRVVFYVPKIANRETKPKDVKSCITSVLALSHGRQNNLTMSIPCMNTWCVIGIEDGHDIEQSLTACDDELCSTTALHLGADYTGTNWGIKVWSCGTYVEYLNIFHPLEPSDAM